MLGQDIEAWLMDVIIIRITITIRIRIFVFVFVFVFVLGSQIQDDVDNNNNNRVSLLVLDVLDVDHPAEGPPPLLMTRMDIKRLQVCRTYATANRLNNDPNHPTAMTEEAVEWMWW
jgi:hypothetical protein